MDIKESGEIVERLMKIPIESWKCSTDKTDKGFPTLFITNIGGKPMTVTEEEVRFEGRVVFTGILAEGIYDSLCDKWGSMDNAILEQTRKDLLGLLRRM